MTSKTPSNIYSTPMDDKYHPEKVEQDWDQRWESLELYKPHENPEQDPFVIVLPPPNVTGSLHLGHALTVAIQDSVCRWNRMKGRPTLWVPGLDHAGIATQVIVEKQLKKTTGKSRHDLGREEFVKKVWEWKEQYGSTILAQLRSLGTSLDWSRLRFTLDEMCAKAVLHAFVQMAQKKIAYPVDHEVKDSDPTHVIYRDNRLVSWSCTLKSAISSIEVEQREFTGPTMVKVPGFDGEVEVGAIHSFSYQVKDSDEKLTVATTRIETMLGDVAVAVNSQDPRYTHLHGKELIHPFIPDRVIKVITDDKLVDMNFGTGAVKITPAHDPNDYECGKRNALPSINILDDEGKMNKNAGEKYFGMHRFAVRQQIIQDLTEMGLYVGKAANPMSIGFCERSSDIVEPLVKPQWWVSCGNMAARGLDAAKTGELTILPTAQKSTWDQWLGNIQDWCISRQLWWGHRIPAYYALSEGQTWPVEVEEPNRWFIALTVEEAQKQAEDKLKGEKFTLHQDEDVLDTWFSSGLFPFSVLGWPDKTPDFDQFFPGSLLETGTDILFFWVARMVMMSQELTDKLPFSHVYLHSLVRDRLGRKMSKSLGNVIDPLDVIQGISLESLLAKLSSGNLGAEEVAKASASQMAEFPTGIEQCGADALRFGLLSYCKQGGDINLDINVIVGSRHFCNKLWQAMRFALQNFTEDFVVPVNGFADVKAHADAAGGFSFEAEWILSRLQKIITTVNDAFTNYEFGIAATALQNFFVDDLCSRYLEFIKQSVKKDSTSYNAIQAQALLSVLFYCLDNFLRLMHPIMPFVTEELYHRLPGHEVRAKMGKSAREQTGSIMVQAFPQLDPGLDAELSRLSQSSPTGVEDRMGLVLSSIEAIRQVKARLELPPKVRPTAFLECRNEDAKNLFNSASHLIATLGCITSPLAISPEEQTKLIEPGSTVRALITADIILHLQVDGKSVDFSTELVKNERRLEENKTEYNRLQTVIEKTKDNPKVKEEVKAANLAAFNQFAVEIPLLENNIEVYKKIVDPQQYIFAQIKDLELQHTNQTKAAVKLEEAIAKAKKPSERQIAELAALKTLLTEFQAKIAELQAQCK